MKSWFSHSKRVVIKSYQEYNDLIQSLEEKAFFRLPDNLKSDNRAWFGETPRYSVSKVTRMKKNGMRDTKLVVFTSNDVDRCIYTLKPGIGGAEALKEVNEIFKERTNKSLVSAFGRITENQQEFAEFSARSLGFNQLGAFEHVYKADISSAYPAAICGSLPDAHGMKRIQGFVEPTDEYPFAFYLKSGNVIIKDELDTRDLNEFVLKNTGKIKNGKFQQAIRPIDYFNEETILMKKSDYELTPEMLKLYERKSIPEYSEETKQILVSFIGRMDSYLYNRWNYQGHLSTISYTRHLKRMSDLITSIQNLGGEIIHIIVDCISWKGKIIPEVTKKKYLGAFHIEAVNTDYAIINRYKYSYFDTSGKLIRKGEDKDFEIDMKGDYIYRVWENQKIIWEKKDENAIF